MSEHLEKKLSDLYGRIEKTKERQIRQKQIEALKLELQQTFGLESTVFRPKTRDPSENHSAEMQRILGLKDYRKFRHRANDAIDSQIVEYAKTLGPKDVRKLGVLFKLDPDKLLEFVASERPESELSAFFGGRQGAKVVKDILGKQNLREKLKKAERTPEEKEKDTMNKKQEEFDFQWEDIQKRFTEERTKLRKERREAEEQVLKGMQGKIDALFATGFEPTPLPPMIPKLPGEQQGDEARANRIAQVNKLAIRDEQLTAIAAEEQEFYDKYARLGNDMFLRYTQEQLNLRQKYPGIRYSAPSRSSSSNNP